MRHVSILCFIDEYHVYLVFRIEFKMTTLHDIEKIKIGGMLGKPADQRVFVKKRTSIGLLYYNYENLK